MYFCFSWLIFWLFLAPLAQAQSVVFRCETEGRVSYSREKCDGGSAIDTTYGMPTRKAEALALPKAPPTVTTPKIAAIRPALPDIKPQLSTGNALTSPIPPSASVLGPARAAIQSDGLSSAIAPPLAAQVQQVCSRLKSIITELASPDYHTTPELETQAEREMFRARQQFKTLNC